MLEVRNLTIKIGNNRILIKNLSFTLNAGDKIAVIGEEGNGKSTLFAAITNRRQVEEYASISGSVVFPNEKIGFLKQSLDDFWFDKKIEEYFIDYEDYEIYKMFNRLQIPAELLYSGQLIGTLSGGEKIKIQLAKVLLDQPTILLLDEPSNDLDIDMIGWLENFIKKAKEAILFISHDIELLRNCAKGILQLEQLKKKTEPVWNFAMKIYDEYVVLRQEKINKQNQVAAMQRDKDAKRQERWQQIYNRVDHEQATISRQDPHGGRLLKKKMKAVKSQEIRFERERENFLDFIDPEEAINIKFENKVVPKSKIVIDKNFDKISVAGKTLLKNINIKIVGPEKVVIIGKNGIGKSTLLKAIFNYLVSESKLKVGYMPQNYNDIFDEFVTVRDFLKENTSSKEELSFVMTMLGSLKFTEEEMNGTIDSLSGGLKAKLFLAKIMAEKPDVLILDEPTRNLSPLSSPVLQNAIKSFGGTVISISHDRNYIKNVATKILELTKDGLFVIN